MQFLGILEDVEKVSTEVPKMIMYKLPGGRETLKTWDMIEDVETTPSAPVVSRFSPFNQIGYFTYSCREQARFALHKTNSRESYVNISRST